MLVKAAGLQGLSAQAMAALFSAAYEEGRNVSDSSTLEEARCPRDAVPQGPAPVHPLPLCLRALPGELSAQIGFGVGICPLCTGKIARRHQGHQHF